MVVAAFADDFSSSRVYQARNEAVNTYHSNEFATKSHPRTLFPQSLLVLLVLYHVVRLLVLSPPSPRIVISVCTYLLYITKNKSLLALIVLSHYVRVALPLHPLLGLTAIQIVRRVFVMAMLAVQKTVAKFVIGSY